jgi:glucose-6-phosphate 1-dehydrogenase
MGEMTETQVQANPLLEGLGPRRTPEPSVLVIFGASGDLTRRKIFPALYALACRRLLPERVAIVGASRSDWTDDEFRDRMEHAVREFGRDDFKQDVWDWLAEGTHYLSMDFADESGEDELAELLNRLDGERSTRGNRVYYLAVPPQAMPIVVKELGKRRKTEGWTRLIVEKPFGHDLASARELTTVISRYFTEEEVFRIDHYLGKETVQNMLALRFANGIFEPIWNRQFVDHIQITVAETIGIEGRAEYYEKAGAVRDIFQNHMLQLVALTAMEPPIDFSADSVRNEKVKVLKAMHTPGPKHVVRGQYGPGYIEGKEVRGYREEEGVDPRSTTETYVAAKLFVDNWRWADTPIYVRTGKRLARRETTIGIQFKRAPHPPFEEATTEELQPNLLLVHVQPDEGVSLAIGAKVPGQGLRIRTVHMDFLYGGAFRTELPEAYERLLLDAMLGDQTLFTRSDEVEEQWALVDAIVAAWARDRPAFPNYAAGTWGPAAAADLMNRDGREWLRQ